MRPKGSRIAAPALLVVTALAGLSSSGAGRAEAAFPGRNGLIVFESDRTDKVGEHINLVRLDKAGRKRGTTDLGRGFAAVPSPNGTKVAFLRRGGTDCLGLYVMAVDGSDLRTLARGCEIGGEPNWSPDGSKLAFSGPAGLTIADLDAGTSRSVGRAGATSWSSDGQSIVYEEEPGSHPGFLYKLRLTDGSTPLRFRFKGTAPRWSPDGGSIAYLSSQSYWGKGKVILMRPNGRGHEAVTPEGVEAFEWSPTGRRIAFLRRPRPTAAPVLYIVDRDGSHLRRLAAHFPYFPFSWSPDGRFLAAATGSARIHLIAVDRQQRRRFGFGWPQQLGTGPLGWVSPRTLLLSTRLGTNDRELFAFDPDTAEVRTLTENTAADFDAAGSPDGTRIAFVSDRRGPGGGALYVMDLRGRSLSRVSKPGIAPRSPAWAPDGKSIAYVRNPRSAIQIRNLQTGKERRVARGEDPAWSPDGTQIAYAAGEIYVVGVNGGSPRRLTSNPNLDRSPNWSPDGRRLAFVTRLDKNDIHITGLKIALINADGAGLIHLPGYGRNPAWSADGKKIVFDRRGAIWSMDGDGNSLTRLTPAGTPVARAEQNPDWLPSP